MLGLGNLEIESASTDGEQTFSTIRRPSDIQKQIYVQMERNSNRQTDRRGQVVAGATASAAPAAAAPNIEEQINQLATLRDQGHLSEAEFQARRPTCSTACSGVLLERVLQRLHRRVVEQDPHT